MTALALAAALAVGVAAASPPAGARADVVALPGPWDHDATAGLVEHRLRVAVPPRLAGEPLALGVSPAIAAWEIRVDGQRVGRQGVLAEPGGRDGGPTGGLGGGGREGPFRARALALPASSRAAPSFELTVRAWRDPRLGPLGEVTPEDTRLQLALGPLPAMADAAALSRYRHARGHAAAPLALALVFALIGVYHILLHRGRREQAGYLWFGLLSLALCGWNAVWGLWHAGYDLGLSYAGVVRVAVTFAVLSLPVGLPFVAALVGGVARGPVGRAWAWTGLAAAVAVLVPADLGLRLAASPLPDALVLGGAALGTGATLAALRTRPGVARSLATGMLVLLALLAINYLAGVKHVTLLTAEVPVASLAFLALVGSMALALARHFDRTLRHLDARNAELQAAYEATTRFVPFEFLEQLGKARITEVALGDQVEREMTILFSDIRAFTTLSERLAPQESFDLINRYLSRMEPVVKASGGFVDKYIGDAIMALFCSPGGRDAGAEKALEAAVGMCGALVELNRALEAEGGEALRIGVGLHTGRLMLGTIGGLNRMDGTVISDAVNTAARVEGMTKLYGAAVLVTDAVCARLPDPARWSMREVDRVVAKGRQQAVTVYEVLDADPPAERARKEATREALREALAAARAGDADAAEAALARCEAAPGPPDPVVALHRARLGQLRRDPTLTWDEITHLQTK